MNANTHFPAEGERTRPDAAVLRDRAAQVVAALKRRHFRAQYVESAQAAVDALLGMLPEGCHVFRSESPALDQLDVASRLRANGRHTVMHVGEKDAQGRSIHGDLDPQAIATLERQVFFADAYLTTATAVTLDGKVVTGDMRGNRAAPMIFGPPLVLIVMGINQIVNDRDEAFQRIDAMAREAGDPRLSYNSTGMLEGALPRFSERINVVLVGEDLPV